MMLFCSVGEDSPINITPPPLPIGAVLFSSVFPMICGAPPNTTIPPPFPPERVRLLFEMTLFSTRADEKYSPTPPPPGPQLSCVLDQIVGDGRRSAGYRNPPR